MRDKIKNILKDVEDLKLEFKKWCKDKTIPLNERWDVFIESKLGTIDSFYRNPPGINWNKKTLYDDFYTEKRETLAANDMLDMINQEFDTFDWDEQKEIEFKESFLQDFCKGFINDW
jgi:hypothetical protein